MTKIRLARTGSRHQPYYRIVVTDSRNRRDGRFIEILGSFNPHSGTVQLNAERAEYWLSVGAQPTNTTISLLTKGGAKHSLQPRRKPVKPVEAKAEAEAVKEEEAIAEELAEEATAEAATEEAPAEETTPEEPAAEEAVSQESTTEEAA